MLGASVKLNDQTGIAGRGVVTDLEGKFTLTGVPSGSTLTVYYIGYQKQFIMLGNKTHVKVVLKKEIPNEQEEPTLEQPSNRQQTCIDSHLTFMGLSMGNNLVFIKNKLRYPFDGISELVVLIGRIPMHWYTINPPIWDP